MVAHVLAAVIVAEREAVGDALSERAIDKDGAKLDFLLADRRNAKAAKRFLGGELKRSRAWIPRVINTDKNPAYGEAITELKNDG